MKTVDVLIGLPGAGKTEYAKSFVISNPDWMIITLDAIREMLYGRYVYKDSDQSMVQRIAGFIVGQIAKSGRNVILDDTVLILTKASRKELIMSLRAMFYSEGIVIRAIVFNYDFDICLNRRLRDPRGVSSYQWKQVITELMRQYEPVYESEDFDKISFIDSTMKGIK